MIKNEKAYELNKRFAKALNLEHKEELDKEENRYSGGVISWNKRTISSRINSNSRFKNIDFTMNFDILLAYAKIFKLDILNNEKSKVIVTINEESKDFENETLVESLMEAIIYYAKRKRPKEENWYLVNNFENEI